jgi:hypothetical protein
VKGLSFEDQTALAYRLHQPPSMKARLIPLLLALGCSGVPATAPPAPIRSEPIPIELRLLLDERMQRHGYDLTHLLWSMLLLEDEASAGFAQAIAEDTTLSGLDGPTEAQLPRRFLELELELRTRAKALARAVRSTERDSRAVSEAFAELSRTCIQCHSTYLADEALTRAGE